MANVEKVSIALTVDLAAQVRQAVESGDYASTSEVVREALRDWKARRDLKAIEIDALRRLWDEGIQSGAARFGSVHAIKAEARRRAKKQAV